MDKKMISPNMNHMILPLYYSIYFMTPWDCIIKEIMY